MHPERFPSYKTAVKAARLDKQNLFPEGTTDEEKVEAL